MLILICSGTRTGDLMAIVYHEGHQETLVLTHLKAKDHQATLEDRVDQVDHEEIPEEISEDTKETVLAVEDQGLEQPVHQASPNHLGDSHQE